MKRSLIYFFLVMSFASHAQNWNAFNKAYRYNYIYDHNQLITNVLFADTIRQYGLDTLYALNRIGIECTGTCPTLTTSIASTMAVIVPNIPQFLQRNIIKKVDGSVVLSDTASWLIKPNCVLNETWTFDAINSKTALCISVSTIAIFNLLDSLKTIIIDGTDSLLLSKKFGIVQFPNVYGKNKYYRLVGIENANVYQLYSNYGMKVPNAWDFFSFDIGDKFCHSKSALMFFGSSSQPYQSCVNSELEVLTKIYIPSSGFRYTFKALEQNCLNGGTYTFSSVSDNAFYGSAYSLNFNSKLRSDNIMYPGMIVYHGYDFNPYSNGIANITKFAKDSNGRFYKYAGSLCQTYPNLSLPLNNISSSWIAYTQNINNTWSIPYYYAIPYILSKVYGEGLGCLSDRLIPINGYDIMCLNCAYKNGSLYLGQETDVGIKESNGKWYPLNIYPNPTNGTLIIDSKDVKVSEIRLNNLLGQTIKSENNFRNEKVVLDMKDQVSGIYFLQIFYEGKLIDVRKVIKN